MARPSKFTKEISEAICDRLAGGESLRQICRDPEMPSRESVRRWLRDDQEFRALHARAREDQADHYAEEILEIADDGTNDWQERELKSGRISSAPDHEHISRSKLRIDTRRWLIAILAPKKYGDRARGEETPAAPVTIFINSTTLPVLQAGYREFREVAHGRN